MNEGSKFDFIKHVDTISMDPGEVRAVEFAKDPWLFMQHFVRQKREESADNSSSLAIVTIDELTSLLQTAIDNNIQIESLPLHSYLNSPKVHERQRGLFQFMKDIGVTKTELLSWVNMESDEDDPEAKLFERAERVILNQIYDKD